MFDRNPESVSMRVLNVVHTIFSMYPEPGSYAMKGVYFIVLFALEFFLGLKRRNNMMMCTLKKNCNRRRPVRAAMQERQEKWSYSVNLVDCFVGYLDQKNSGWFLSTFFWIDMNTRSPMVRATPESSFWVQWNGILSMTFPFNWRLLYFFTPSG